MILVTGGTGLVGSHLLYELTKTEDHVRAIYRTAKKIEHVKNVFSYYTSSVESQFSKIEWVEAELNDIPKLEKAFESITYVYHCAALISFAPNDYHLLRQTNIMGTANIVNLCIKNTIKKLCYVSSIQAIGEDDPFINEDTPWNKDLRHNVYSITKYGAEMEIWRGVQEGVPAVVVNPGIIIGSGYWKSGSGLLFKIVYKGMKRYTAGYAGYVDIADVIKSMTQLMGSSISNERFILVGENLTFQDVTQQIAKGLKVPPPSKPVSKFALQLGWRLDWLQHKITGRKRRLSKAMVKTMTSSSQYSNEKIKSSLQGFKFRPIESSIAEVCQRFLTSVSSRK